MDKTNFNPDNQSQLLNNPDNQSQLQDTIKKVKKRIKPVEILKLRMKGLSNSEIARLANTSVSNVTQRLHSVISKLELLTDKDKLADYKAKKVDILTGVEYEILKYMTDKTTLKAASLNNLAYSLQNINNISRLEQGKSTHNLSHIHALHDELVSKLDKLDTQLSTAVNAPTPESVPDGND